MSAGFGSRVERVLEDEGLPLVVGGDHSIAVGTVAAVSSFHARRDERIGILWFDAHGDMNTPETTPSGNVHGMPLACCLGYGHEALVGLGDTRPMVRPQDTVLIGIRDVDPGERALEQRLLAPVVQPARETLAVLVCVAIGKRFLVILAGELHFLHRLPG